MEHLVAQINTLFGEFQKQGAVYKGNVGKGRSVLGPGVAEAIEKNVPKLLFDIFDKNSFEIRGSVGVGRISQCPWVAIRYKDAAESTSKGVYIVFLFSRDLQDVYLTFNQGVTKIKKTDIIRRRDEIRNALKMESEILRHDNDFNVDNESYRLASIYATKWDPSDNKACVEILKAYIDVYSKYVSHFIKGASSGLTTTVAPKKVDFSIDEVIKHIASTGLRYDPNLVKRFACSLMAKPFVILSGLAGSGKTQLALAFAKALVEKTEWDNQICIVAVGADWTNREPLLGYPNALDSTKYVRPESGVLGLLMRAIDEGNENKPYFLILDEMNMSYVERYFADFLSGMESKEPIRLWNHEEEDGVKKSKDGVDESIKLPDNLYIIGTINVDETTYMFSPKVLDRASVIEFKISVEEMTSFLKRGSSAKPGKPAIDPSTMAESFLERSRRAKIEFGETEIDEFFEETLISFFEELKSVNAEFGYRSATEIYRYIVVALGDGGTGEIMDRKMILDSAIVQKLLPKLHGSRKKLTPVLRALWGLCCPCTNLDEATSVPDGAEYPLSADKILRMYRYAVDNGFASFSEA